MMNKPLHPLYHELDHWLPPSGHVLELGAGVGHGVVHLLNRGFSVTAIDAEAEAVAILRRRAPQAEVIEARFEQVALKPESYNVVVAGFSLFFLTSSEFQKFWPRLVASIRPEGIFAGEFLGNRDDWVTDGYLGHSETEVRQLLDKFEILHWEDAERDGKTSQGTPKHWHVYHVIARLRDL